MNQFTKQQLDQAAGDAAKAAAEMAAAQVAQAKDGEIAAVKNDAATKERSVAKEVQEQMSAINTALIEFDRAMSVMHQEFDGMLDGVEWPGIEMPDAPEHLTAQHVHHVIVNIRSASVNVAAYAGAVASLKQLLRRAKKELEHAQTFAEDPNGE